MFVDIGNNKVYDSFNSSISPKHRLRASYNNNKEGQQQGISLLDESCARPAHRGHRTGAIHDLYDADDGYFVAKSGNSSSDSVTTSRRSNHSSHDSRREVRCEKDDSAEVAHLRAPASGEARQYVHRNTVHGYASAPQPPPPQLSSAPHRRHHSHHYSSHSRHRGTHSRDEEDSSRDRRSPTPAAVKRATWHDTRGLLVPPTPAKDAGRQQRSYSEQQCSRPRTQTFMSNSAQATLEAATRQRLIDGRRNNNNNNNDSGNKNNCSKLGNSLGRRSGNGDPPVPGHGVGETREGDGEAGENAPAHAMGDESDNDGADRVDGVQDENVPGRNGHSLVRIAQERQPHGESRKVGGYVVAPTERPSNGTRVAPAERHPGRDAVEAGVACKEGGGRGGMNGIIATAANGGGGVSVPRHVGRPGSASSGPAAPRRNHTHDAADPNRVVAAAAVDQRDNGQEEKAEAGENGEEQRVHGVPAEAAKPHAGPQLAQTKIQLGVQLKHWVIVSRIGAGSFGETFTAIEVDWPVPQDDSLDVSPAAAALLEHLPSAEERHEVCIKVEQENKNVLRLEALALKKVQPCPQVVRYYASGCTAGMNYLVMEKLGPNLADLRRRSPHGTFNIYTTLKAGISCLQAIRGVHDQGLVHRDIKPSNFVTGLPGTAAQATCFLIDFGLARRFRRSNGTIRPARANAGFRGTSRYASVASHHHSELGRVDDLWSLLFMLVEFATGSLPWRKYKEKEAIGRCKEESISPYLVRNLPREFQPFLAHLTTLSYEDEPDYDLLLGLMQSAVKRRGYPADKLVDWELDPSLLEATAEAEWHAAPHRAPVARAERGPEADDKAAHDSGPGRGHAESPRGAVGVAAVAGLAHGNGTVAAPGQEIVTPAAVAEPVTVSLPQSQVQVERRFTADQTAAERAVAAAAPPLAPSAVGGEERAAEVVGDGREKGGGRVAGAQAPPPRPHTAELNSASRAQALNTSTLRVSEVELSCRPHSPAVIAAGGEKNGVADEFSSDVGAAVSHAGVNEAAGPSMAPPPPSRPPILAPPALAAQAANETNAAKPSMAATPPHELASSAHHDTEEVEVFDTVDIFSPREAETRSRPRLEILLSPPVPYTELTPREESPPPPPLPGVPAAGPVVVPPACSPHPVAIAAGVGVTGATAMMASGTQLGNGAASQAALSPEPGSHKGARHKAGKLNCNCCVM